MPLTKVKMDFYQVQIVAKLADHPLFIFFRYSASAETGFLAEVTYEGEAIFPDENKR